MTDLEITRLCAEAMGYRSQEATDDKSRTWLLVWNGGQVAYDPLQDDAQAMALVKKFRLFVGGNSDQYMVQPQSDMTINAWSANLNFAICECVAKMQQAKALGK